MHSHHRAKTIVSALTASLLTAGSGALWLTALAQESDGRKPTKTITYEAKPEAENASDEALPDGSGSAASAPTGKSESGTEEPEAPVEQAQGTTLETAEKQDTTSDPEVLAETTEEAAAAAQRAKEMAESAAYQHYVLGNYYMQKWDMPMAEVELDQAVCKYPDMLAAHRDLCLVSLMRCNLLRSLAEFMMVVGLGEAIPYNDKEKVDLSNKALVAHYKKGLQYARESNWKESRTELEWALSYGTNDYAVHHSLAFAYSNLGDYARAEEEYEATFKNCPRNALAHADLADMLAKTGQSERAQEEMTRAVQLSPQATALHVDLGWIAESRGDLSTAATEFRTACGISPTHAGLWTHLGRLLERQGQPQQAMEAYSKALAIKPDQNEARSSLERLKQRASGGLTSSATNSAS